ncbi:hypothetical protein ASZ78_003443 [Callipepla squamata]|uniref:Uncharacterized protein n=1 Tax=Callipepla squamata TaxID=9009 RepID=A0A226NNG7_CALSU|nr:hypothetical protein ASZ78_003443 [Callipepla squamata]
MGSPNKHHTWQWGAGADCCQTAQPTFPPSKGRCCTEWCSLEHSQAWVDGWTG